MYNFSIGSLNIISAGTVPTGILLQSIEGLDSPNYRNTTFALPGRHGATVSSQFYGERLVKMTGKIEGRTPAEYEANRKALVAITAIQLDDFGSPVTTRVSMTTLGGAAYYFDAVFDKPVFNPSESPVDCNFLLTAIVPNAFIYGDATISSGNVSRATGGGYVVPMIAPYISAGTIGGSTTVTNPGSETTYPTLDSNGNGGIRFVGPLTNPVLTNLTTGKTLELSYSLGAGNYIAVDMNRQIILLNGSSSLISRKTISSDWWGIAPGANTIKLDTSSNSDTGYVTLSFSPAYGGV